ncbi:MAG TPA: TetR/AcrR family transcriptional regulator [Candidatus Methylomirabilis sp.]|nr:TetR/AcrR family transcriptional regulator [Candidatus Methylomirabilis sp.]
MARDIETVVKDQDLVARRHAQISDAALKLFSQKGYHRTTVREIAVACGLGIGTLYSYIKTKEDILTIVYSRILESFEGRMREATQGIDDPRLQLKAAIEGTLRVYAEYQEAVVLLYQESHALERQTLQSLFDVDRSYVSFFREILERGARDGCFAVGESQLTAVSILFLCAVWNLKRWNLKGYTLDNVIKSLTDLILDGIAVNGSVRS